MEKRTTEIAAGLRRAIAVKEREVRRELDELGAIHQNLLLQKGRCPCTVPGSREKCPVADCLERGAEELSGDPMPAGGNRSTN
jgi:hypothetical protein